jgi:hypothetical protein
MAKSVELPPNTVVNFKHWSVVGNERVSSDVFREHCEKIMKARTLRQAEQIAAEIQTTLHQLDLFEKLEISFDTYNQAHLLKIHVKEKKPNQAYIKAETDKTAAFVGGASFLPFFFGALIYFFNFFFFLFAHFSSRMQVSGSSLDQCLERTKRSPRK